MARMLVIDDEERIRKLLHTVLKRKGTRCSWRAADRRESTCSSGHVR